MREYPIYQNFPFKIYLSAEIVKNPPVKIACVFVKLSEDKVGSKMGTTLKLGDWKQISSLF